MITINKQPLADNDILSQYPENSNEQAILKILLTSPETYNYDSLDQLKFELKLRNEIIKAADALYKSRLNFKVFRDSKVNPDFWERMNNGGFKLKAGVKPSDAIKDIFQNSSRYGTECATAMMIIYYKALLEIFPEEAFNKMFPDIILMNWHNIPGELREVGLMQKIRDGLPGDRRYFANPDVDPITPEWQGENVIDMGNGLYYGHGVGKHRAEAIIKMLNRNRREDAKKEAYFMEEAGRPNFRRLFELYNKATAVSYAVSYAV